MYTVWLNKHDVCMWLWICTPIPQNVMYVCLAEHVHSRAKDAGKCFQDGCSRCVPGIFSKCPTFLSMTWGSCTATITCCLVYSLFTLPPCLAMAPQKTTWSLAPVTGTAPARCHWRSCPPPVKKSPDLEAEITWFLISSDIISATFRDLE